MPGSTRYRSVRPAPLLALTLVWLLLWGRATWFLALSGLVVGALVLRLFPLPPLMSTVRLRPLPAARLVLTFLVELVTASFTVAWLAFRPRPVGPGALLDARLDLQDDLRRTIVAEMTSLVPGTVVLDLDGASGIMTIHVLDTTDPTTLDRERAKIRALERRVAAAVAVDRRTDAGGDDD